MVKLTKIYTRTGDGGETGLVDGSRLSKSALRMEAIGDVDEANSAIGVALTRIDDETARAMLGRIQNELFDLGADIATPGEDFAPSEMVLRIVAAQIARLEAEIDTMNASLAPLSSFILPGGDPGRHISTSPERSSAAPSARWSAQRARRASTHSRSPTSIACRIISSCSAACSTVPARATFSGSQAPRAADPRVEATGKSDE